MRASPADAGTVELIVRRPAPGERDVLDVGELSTELGLVGEGAALRLRGVNARVVVAGTVRAGDPVTKLG